MGCARLIARGKCQGEQQGQEEKGRAHGGSIPMVVILVGIFGRRWSELGT